MEVETRHNEAIQALQAKLEAAERKHKEEMASLQEQVETERERSKRRDEEMKRVDDELRRQQSSGGDREEELRAMKISFEKMISAKDKEIEEVEERLRLAMARNAEHGNSQQAAAEFEQRLQSVATQHQKELRVLHQSHQKMLDLKDKELEDFSYRLRTVTSTQQKDLEKLHQANRTKIAEMEEKMRQLEAQLKSKEMENRWLEDDVESSEVFIVKGGGVGATDGELHFSHTQMLLIV